VQACSPPRNLSLFDHAAEMMLERIVRTRIVLPLFQSEPLSLSLSLSARESVLPGAINVHLNYRSTAIRDGAYPMQFRGDVLLSMCLPQRAVGESRTVTTVSRADDGFVTVIRLCLITSDN